MPRPRTLALLAALSLAPGAVAQLEASAHALFERDGAGSATLRMHPFEIPTLDRVMFDLPTGPIEVDLHTVRHTGPASYSMAGTHPDMPLLHAMITVNGPAISAVISHPDLGTHRFEHTDRRGGTLTLIAPPTVPLCGCDCASHDAAFDAPHAKHADANTHADRAADAAVEGRATPRGFELCRDSLTQIDVLVLYTQKAIDLAGGDVSVLEASVQMGIDEFNLACMNGTTSGIVPQANLVHTAFTPYPETTTSSGLHLDRLRDIGDGEIDDAHTLREEHKADVVILVGGAMDVCGRAYIGVLPGNTARPDLAFGVVNYNCTNAPTYAFAHELGHILGALHDFEADYCDTGSQTYAHGYIAPDESYATIMATLTTAPRIPYFSDASATFMGQPVGDGAIARNAFAFRVGAATTVAQYRLSDCNGGGFCDDREIELDLVDDLDGNGVPDECQLDEDQNGTIDDLEIQLDSGLDLDADGMLDSMEQPVRFVDASAMGTGTGLSWADAHTDLHVALDAVVRSGGDIGEVWVAGGVYKPTGSGEARGADFLVPSNTTLYGSFAGTESSPLERDIDANPTVFSGDLAGNDNPNAFNAHRDNSLTLMRFSRGVGIVVDGFTFNGGYGDTKANCGFYNHGGGVFAFFSEYTLRNCTFARCGANIGGALGSTDGSMPTLINCDFIENTTVPVDFKTSEGVIVTSEGTASGAYMTSAPDPENDAYIENCRFIGNTVGAALVNLGGSPVIIGSLFARNEARLTAGISNSSTQGSDATIINCTVVDNVATANAAGVGIGNSRSQVEIINSIIYGNRANGALNANTQVNTNGGGATIIRDSIMEGPDEASQAGTSYINVSGDDPLFTDAMSWDYTLGAVSPAIDAGDTSALDPYGVLLDIDGSPRFADDPGVLDTGLMSITDPGRAIVDLGAFERVPANSCSADFDGDGDVDLGDFGVFGAAFNSGSSDMNYNPSADFDGDGDVDLGDFGVFGSQFNRTDCL